MKRTKKLAVIFTLLVFLIVTIVLLKNTNMKDQIIYKNKANQYSAGIAIASWDISEKEDGSVTAVLDDNGNLVISGNGKMKDYSLFELAPWRANFGHSSKIKNIIINNGITSIGNYMFYLCKNIISVEIPESVTTIGKDAFYSATNLSEINLPNSLTTIKEEAFFCAGITFLEIPSGVKEIPSAMCYGCSKLEEVIFQDGITSIGMSAFSGCDSLNSLEIPTSVTRIGMDAFENLEKIAIPKNVNYIDVAVSFGPNTKIYCHSNSEALKYANENNMSYVIDDNAPTIKSVTGNPTYWTNQDVTLTVNATEDKSWLSNRAYSFDGGKTWQKENTKTYTKNTNGIVVKVKDALGNIATYDTINITHIDKKLPTISNVTGNATKWTKDDVTLTVDATDDISGLDTKAYSFDGGTTWQESNSKTYTENTSNIIVKVKDKAGNIAIYEKIDITNIDKIIPTISDVTGNPTEWTRNDVTLTVDATDDISGLDTKAYSFDNGTTWQENNQKTYTENIDGIIIKVKDKAGNIATYETINITKICKNHNYKNVITEPTCTKKGYTTHTCTICGETYTDDETQAKGHTEVVDEKIEATCTKEGKTEGKHCSACNEVLVKQDVIKAKGHTEVIEAKVEATCTKDGKTEGRHCSVCNEVLVKQEVIKALGHSYSEEWTIDIPATYESKGSKSHHCIRCDEKKDITEIPKMEDTEYLKTTSSLKIKKLNENLEILYGISPDTSVKSLKENFNTRFTIKIKNNKNTDISENEKIGTGSKVQIIKDEEVVKEYVVVIYGDTTEDGKITAVDALAVIKDINNKIQFKDESYREAGRVREQSTEKLSAVDALAIIKSLNGKYTIKQGK